VRRRSGIDSSTLLQSSPSALSFACAPHSIAECLHHAPQVPCSPGAPPCARHPDSDTSVWSVTPPPWGGLPCRPYPQVLRCSSCCLCLADTGSWEDGRAVVEEAFQLVPANVEPLWGENVARLGMPAAHTHAHTRRHPLLRGCSWGHACGVVSPASPPPNPPIPEHCTTHSLTHNCWPLNCGCLLVPRGWMWMWMLRTEVGLLLFWGRCWGTSGGSLPVSDCQSSFFFF